MDKNNGLKIIEFCAFLGKLKSLQRTGWVRAGIPNPETVASHMYRMGVLAFLLDPSRVDRDRCIRMALVHDMAESIVGDITPHDGVSESDKHSREKAAMDRISQELPPSIGAEFLSLWQEYEAASTPEAKAVKDLDKFDMIAQAFEYENALQRPDFLQEFFDSTQESFTTETVKKWADELRNARALATYGEEDSK